MKELPFDIIKIDRSFVEKIEEDALERELIEHFASVASLFGAKVCVEGIENKDTIKNAVMFVSAAYEIRVAMTKEAAVDVMQVVLEKCKQELVELEKQFEEL